MTPIPPYRIAAFSLVEVTLALGISAFALVSVFALLPVGLSSNRAAIEQTAANGILSAVIADLRSIAPTVPPGGATGSTQYAIAIPENPVATESTLPPLYFTSTGEAAASEQTGSRYRLTVTSLPNGLEDRAATLLSLKVSWQASLPPDKAVGSIQTFVALDRN